MSKTKHKNCNPSPSLIYAHLLSLLKSCILDMRYTIQIFLDNPTHIHTSYILAS
jgi:hypothetical protein